MSVHDYRITAEVRRRLVSRWVDISRLQIGTTNGVVYLIGVLEPSVEDALERSGIEAEREASTRLVRLMTTVEKELRRIPEVRDIVFNLENLRKRGRVWSVTRSGGKRAKPSGPLRVSVPVAGTVELSDDPEEEEDGKPGSVR